MSFPPVMAANSVSMTATPVAAPINHVPSSTINNQSCNSSLHEVVSHFSFSDTISRSMNVLNNNDYDYHYYDSSTVECDSSVSKDLEVSDLKHYIKDLEAKNNDMYKKSKEIPASTTTAAVSWPERKKKMHNPPKRPSVELADYYDLAEGEEPRNGFVCLAPGISIAVSSLWLQKLLTSIPKKKPRKNIESPQRPLGFDIIKRLIDGFYEPWHLNVGGGTTGFSDTPVFKSLRRYAEHKLNMNQSTFNRAWLEKMSSAKSIIKRLGKNQLHQLMTGNLNDSSDATLDAA